jgi:hypothetical protein
MAWRGGCRAGPGRSRRDLDEQGDVVTDQVIHGTTRAARADVWRGAVVLGLLTAVLTALLAFTLRMASAWARGGACRAPEVGLRGITPPAYRVLCCDMCRRSRPFLMRPRSPVPRRRRSRSPAPVGRDEAEAVCTQSRPGWYAPGEGRGMEGERRCAASGGWSSTLLCRRSWAVPRARNDHSATAVLSRLPGSGGQDRVGVWCADLGRAPHR